jgi:hypothetical protein
LRRAHPNTHCSIPGKIEPWLEKSLAKSWRRPPLNGVYCHCNTPRRPKKVPDFGHFQIWHGFCKQIGARGGGACWLNTNWKDDQMTISRSHKVLAAATSAVLFVAGFAAPAGASERNSSVAATAAKAAATTGGRSSARVDMQAGDSTVCVRGTGVLSRIVRTTCRTAQEWENRGGFIRG